MRNSPDPAITVIAPVLAATPASVVIELMLNCPPLLNVNDWPDLELFRSTGPAILLSTAPLVSKVSTLPAMRSGEFEKPAMEPPLCAQNDTHLGDSSRYALGMTTGVILSARTVILSAAKDPNPKKERVAQACLNHPIDYKFSDE